MEIVDIFAIIKNKLLSVQFEPNDCDEFTLAFRNWNDTEYLEDFFENNKNDLQSGFYGNISVEEAIFSTIEEAEVFEEKIRRVAKIGKFKTKSSLQELVFYPLHKNDQTYKLQETRAYGTNSNSWLRIFAIRISPECFVVSGSAIKLTGAMGDQNHTAIELTKLKITAAYLKQNGLLEEEDFGYIDIIN
ncbi:hypothetical protein BWK63_07460 [Flavobacterium covae]|uniref:Uncharacterized protein n=1 Tax=Flavobacterium covae TaxID=2906076 RepID=A0ABW8PIU2_9FLAO|nr:MULTISPECIES: hypothetical protein [Flavobacterium]OWP81141.1 hypothetical protein BWK63_07460 [Flavobacterium covae]POR22766.1 hypothetical protein BWK57_04790 [Flavobacterium columnare]